MNKQEIDALLKESEEFIQSVIQKKYCHPGEKTWSDIVNRYKKGLEEDKSIWEGYNLQKVPRLMAEKKLIPAGSNLYGYKNKAEKVSLSNCYFLAIEHDSMDGIYEFMKQQAKTYSWRGGVGTDISILRPKGAKVNNAAKTSSGAVSFMPLLSENTNTIGQNGRRGAHIITIEDWHPDLPLFIKCKTHPKEVFDYDFINDYTPNVYYANISVKLSDKFFEAVKNDEEWELVYPDIEADKEFYNKHWDGNIKNWLAKGGKIKTYAKVKAKDILNSIAEGMWQGAEPGVLYWDTVLKETQGNLLGTEYEPKGVNPCGEQILSPGGNCNLIGVVLYQFVKNPFTKNATLDFNSLTETLKVALEFGDYTIDINRHPIPIQNEVDKQLRKVGIEFTGLADMLAMLGYEYDNPETIDFVDKLFADISSTLLIHNVEMAKMKGCCPIMKTTEQRQKFLKTPIVQRILKYIQLTQSAEQAKQVYDDILQYGVRNIAWLNNGPTGSISIIANNCTSGIEPLFKIAYVRRSRLLGKETNVLHLPLMKWLIENKPEDLNLPEAELKKKYHYREAHEIDFHYRVKLQGTIQKWVTDSISSTINLPENITPKEIADLILEGWSNGLKGLTIFRDNSIKGVLSTKSDNENKTEQTITKLPIPPERQSFTYTMYWKKVKVYVTIPVVDNYPVEVFAKLPWEAYLDAKGNKSIQLKLEREANWNALSRMVSLALRYKLPIEEITKALDKSSEVLNDLPNIISRALKKTMAKLQTSENKQQEYEICPECGEKQVIKEGGCKKCLACGWSKCE